MRPASWAACFGEAHKNAYIDNCMSCAPFWGKTPVCPDCGIGLMVLGRTGRCISPTCQSKGKLFSTREE